MACVQCCIGTWAYLGRFRNEPVAVAPELRFLCLSVCTQNECTVVQLLLRYSLWKKHDALPEVFDTRAESPTQARRPAGTQCIVVICEKILLLLLLLVTIDIVIISELLFLL